VVEKRFHLNSWLWGVPKWVGLIGCLMGSGVMNCLPQGLAPAVSQQAVIDAQAQQNRNRQAQQLGQQKEEKEQSVETSEISKDLGSVQLMREVPSLPFARLRIDQTYNWLSNASYAKSSANVLASWQTISSIEAAWAPSITSMPGYDKFFPEAGFRASFFNYFQQE
jgi:hypothetical protein